MYKKLLFLVLISPVTLFAQNTYDLVYTTLNVKCSNAACHSSTSADALKFDGSSASVYSSIINQTPATAAAVTRGEKLVWVNQPYESHLLKRAASWLDTDLSLPVSEADAAHTSCGVTVKEAEYIRQWIINGAKQTGNMVDTALINAYYNDTTRAAFFPKPARPAAGTGIQVRMGPIFVPGSGSGSEVEYLLKHEIDFPTDMEVTSTAGNMDPQSHHFLLFKYDDSASAASMPNGLRKVSLTSGTTSFDGNKALTGAWQTDNNYILPTGTAFFWPHKTWLDLNYHVKNYTSPGACGIFPFDFYLNLTSVTHLPSSATIEMKTRLVNNIGIVILPNSPASFNYADGDNGTNETRYIWMMSSHTHKFGTGFNIYTYDNTKPNNIGDTLYVGTYDYTNGFDRGVYDWEHPSVEYFSPQRQVNFGNSGVICNTKWNNTSGSLIHFGFTTADEMQLYYYMYTTELAGQTAVKTIKSTDFNFGVYPNPMSDMGTIMYTLDNAAMVKASIVDITGNEVAVLKEEKNQAGTYNVDMGSKALAKGIYFARLSVDGSNYTKKFIVE